MASIEQRVTDDGKRRFRVKIRLKGRPVQTATFDRLTDAREWAQRTEAAIKEGRYFKNAEAKRHTLGDLIDRYIQHELPKKPKSKDKQEAQLKWWKERLGDYLLADVTSPLIAEYRDKLATESLNDKGKVRAPATVVRYLAALSHAFTVAVKEWGWIDDSPMRKVSKPKEPRGRVRYLSDNEREALLAACGESRNVHLRLIVLLAISTGMRLGEILGLRWEDINLSGEVGKAILHDTKNGERRAVPLVGPVLIELRRLSEIRDVKEGLIFAAPRAADEKPLEFRSAWDAAVKRANLNDFRFHDLRHTAASYLAMNGATLPEIAAVLGHKTFQMVKRYAHLGDDHVSSVLAAMNKRFLQTELRNG